MEAARSIRTRDNVAHSRVNHHQLLLGNWNVLTLTGKELELVEEAKRYYLDIIGVSSTKREIVESKLEEMVSAVFVRVAALRTKSSL